MSLLTALLERLLAWVPTAVAVAGVALVLMVVHAFLRRRWAARPGRSFRLQLIMLVLSLVGLIIVVMALPVSDTTIGQLLSLIGLLLSAAIALSSTTFLGNVLAGLMLRAVKNFRPGDFIRVENQFGRVSEQGLFHVEIQTEDRDLTTLPNVYLVTHPVKVIRSSGTLVTAEVSLGYDVPHERIETALREAAQEAQLEEPFVYVLDLGNFSVTYRVAGLLTEVKTLLSARSRLREAMLDRLHAAQIEIVSPTFMNQRPLDLAQKFIPPAFRTPERPASEATAPEAVIFDKADEAESLSRLQDRLEQMNGEQKELKEALGQAEDPARAEQIKEQIEALETRRKRLLEYIERKKSEA